MDKLLKVKSLKSWYGASQALFDVNLEINQGEIVALLGRNGLGKSTTIKSICGLINKYDQIKMVGNVTITNTSKVKDIIKLFMKKKILQKIYL